MLLVGSHTIPEGNKRGGYLSIIDKEEAEMPYEKALLLNESTYPLELIEVKFQEKSITGFSPVQSMVIPVTVEDLQIK